MNYTNNMSKQYKSTELWMVLTSFIGIPCSRKQSCIVCIAWGQTIQQTSSSWLQTTQNKFSTIHSSILHSRQTLQQK